MNFYEIPKNIFFIEHLQTTASVSSQGALPNQKDVMDFIEISIIGTDERCNWVITAEVGI